MPDDTSVKSLFDWAKQPHWAKQPLFGEIPQQSVVFATYVQQYANMHPKGQATSDSVMYANGPLKLSTDKKSLSGELKLWRNIYKLGVVNLRDGSDTPPDDAFADASGPVSILITVTEDGEATYQLRTKDKANPSGPTNPVGGMAPSLIKATYDAGLFVENEGDGHVRVLSFTLGTTLARQA